MVFDALGEPELHELRPRTSVREGMPSEGVRASRPQDRPADVAERALQLGRDDAVGGPGGFRIEAHGDIDVRLGHRRIGHDALQAGDGDGTRVHRAGGEQARGQEADQPGRRDDRPRGPGAAEAHLDHGDERRHQARSPGVRVGEQPSGAEYTVGARYRRMSMPVRDGRRRPPYASATDAAAMDTTDHAAARVRRFLETEPVIWLSSTRADGAPHLVPTWFVWDGEAIVIMSKPGAVKVRNLRADPRAMLALGDADDDFDVGLLEARADVQATPAAGLPAGFEAKYAERIRALELTPAQFASTYAQVIRLVPVRALAWHGRTTPQSVLSAARRVAATGAASLAEPRRSRLDRLGEPLAHRLDGWRSSMLGPSLAM